jgi:hypothetical protein
MHRLTSKQQEHLILGVKSIHALGSNYSKSEHSDHIATKSHAYGTITNNVDVIRKGRRRNPLMPSGLGTKIY